MRQFLLLSIARFLLSVVGGWLLLFVLLDLLPGVAGDPLGVQFYGDRLAVTLPLTLMAGLISLLVGTAICLAAMQWGGIADRLSGSLATLLSYLPPFWLGLLLALVLTGVLPAGGFVPWSSGIGGALGSLALPALALGLPHAGQFAIQLRGAFGPDPEEAALRPLRIAGLPAERARWRLLMTRALPLIPRLIGQLFATLLVGAVVVENVFYLPGLGRQVLGAALAHDLPDLRAGLFLLIAIAAAIMLLGSLGRLSVDRQLRATP